MIKESTLQKSLDKKDDAAVRAGLKRAAITMIEKDGLFSELRNDHFTTMSVRVPLASLRGSVEVSFRKSSNPYSDPGMFFNAYNRGDKVTVKSIPKKKLIIWGE